MLYVVYLRGGPELVGTKPVQERRIVTVTEPVVFYEMPAVGRGTARFVRTDETINVGSGIATVFEFAGMAEEG